MFRASIKICIFLLLLICLLTAYFGIYLYALSFSYQSRISSTQIKSLRSFKQSSVIEADIVLESSLSELPISELFTQTSPIDQAGLENQFAERRTLVKQKCQKLYGSQKPSQKLDQLQNNLYQSAKRGTFLVDEANKLLICVIAKVASTTQKKLYLFNAARSSFKTFEDIPETIVHNPPQWPKGSSLKALTQIELGVRNIGIKRFLNFTKVMMVRNPYVRLVSAWNSKFRSGNNTYYENLYGNLIRQKYRSNPTTSPNETVYLEDFFNYIGTVVDSFRMADVHWSTYHTQCMPCFIDYDYILKLEHWYPEAYYYFLNVAGNNLQDQRKNELEKAIKPPRSQDAHWKQLIKERLSHKQITSVKYRYVYDFEMFGYDPNEFG